MKFKLINTKTNEEALCDKVTIGSFDYYVSDEKIKELKPDDRYATIVENPRRIVFYTKHIQSKDVVVIATTNSNIDIPQIVDEARELAKKEHYDGTIEGGYLVGGFINGYNKAKKTYQFTEEDIRFMLSESFKASQEGYYITTDEIIHLWKEQQPKTLYYNE